jgi:hypothetical protein
MFEEVDFSLVNMAMVRAQNEKSEKKGDPLPIFCLPVFLNFWCQIPKRLHRKKDFTHPEFFFFFFKFCFKTWDFFQNFFFKFFSSSNFN